MKIEDFNFAGHKAIVRVDFNVPLDENGNVTDDTRIRGALPTLKKVLADGGALIMMSHMGKPKGKVKPELSLSQIVKNVSDALGVDVKFAKDCGNAEAEAAALKPGEALLLENLRFYPEEEGKPVGIDKAEVLEILNVGGGQSLVLNAKKAKLLAEDFSPHFSNALIYKDLHCLQDLAYENKRPLFTGAVTKELYARAIADGMEHLDFSSVYALFKQR